MIRPIAAGDYAAWHYLLAKYFAFYVTQTAPEVFAATWQRLLDPREPVWGAVAVEEADIVVGLVHFLFHRTIWSLEDTCYLQDLFVSPPPVVAATPGN